MSERIAAEFVKLRDEVAELRRENAQLRASIIGEQVLWPSEWKIDPMPRQLLTAFFNAPQGFLTRHQQYAAVGRRGTDFSGSSKVVDVYLCRLRKAIPIYFECHRGRGHRLTPASHEWLAQHRIAVGRAA